jgi:hypothetical protein
MVKICENKSPEELDALLRNLLSIGESDAANVVREILRSRGESASPMYEGGRRKRYTNRKTTKRHPKRKAKPTRKAKPSRKSKSKSTRRRS